MGSPILRACRFRPAAEDCTEYGAPGQRRRPVERDHERDGRRRDRVSGSGPSGSSPRARGGHRRALGNTIHLGFIPGSAGDVGRFAVDIQACRGLGQSQLLPVALLLISRTRVGFLYSRRLMARAS